MEKTRDSQGRLQPDKQRFPSGIKALADYVCINHLLECMQYTGQHNIKHHFKILGTFKETQTGDLCRYCDIKLFVLLIVMQFILNKCF